MALFRELVVWSDYVNVRLTEASIQTDDAEKAAKRAKALYVSQIMATRRVKSVTEAESLALIATEVVDAQDLYDEHNAKRRALRMVAENLDRDSRFISREITRRLGRDDYDRRDSKHGGG